MRPVIAISLSLLLFSCLRGAELDVVELKDGRTLEGVLKASKRYKYFDMDLFYKGKMVATVVLHEDDIENKSKKTVEGPAVEEPAVEEPIVEEPVVADSRMQRLRELAQRLRELARLRADLYREVEGLRAELKAEADKLYIDLADKVLKADTLNWVESDNLREVDRVQGYIRMYKSSAAHSESRALLGAQLSRSPVVRLRPEYEREIVAIDAIVRKLSFAARL